MAEEKKSLLYKLEPLAKRFPAVQKPEGHVHFRSKLAWSLVCLVAYFFLANIAIFGLGEGTIDVFQQFRAILAGASGSVVHLGIGPIVTGSIIMQLFVGAKIINLDLTKPEDKAMYQGTQKLLVVVMIFVESIPQVFGFLQPSQVFANRLDVGLQGGLALGLGVGAMFLYGFIFARVAEGYEPSRMTVLASVLAGLPIGLLYTWLVTAPLGGMLGLEAELGVVATLALGAVLTLAGFAVGTLRSEKAESPIRHAPVLAGPALGGLAIGAVLVLTSATFAFAPSFATSAGAANYNWARFFLIVQLALGSYLVFLMDEVVSKWGLGSGISLFIAAGVSQALFTGMFNWFPAQAADLSVFNPPGGAIPRTVYLLSEYDMRSLVGGGFENIFFGDPQDPSSANAIIALVTTVLVFFFVVYAESSRIELPLAHGKVRGARGRYPIRLIYASNIPVILMAALLANVNLIALLFHYSPAGPTGETFGPMTDWPLFGGRWLAHNAPEFSGWLGVYATGQGQGTSQALGGAAYYLSPVQGVGDWLLPFLNPQRYGGVFAYREGWQVMLHVVLYLVAMIGGSILFAKFWIETTNMGPQAVAKQIQKSGMQIPGFRRDPRIVEKILERYIPVVTVIGGATVGALAAFADMLGTLGQASGTGLLLAVGILQRLYEQIAKEQVMEMHPVLRGFFGER
ncbi:MAG TPA: preprotein translocase subunit SecY [Candidatus Thermoplasmatota archaeon]|nr:preprotein translocase subunit SecY [Candidatus Thermoplasmatota archaeon]